MARIGVDVRCLAEGRRTGVEEYTLNFLEHLFKIDKKNEYVLFLNSFKTPQADFSWIEKFSNVSLKKFRFPNKLLNFSFWYLKWPKIDKLLGGVDFFFMPNIIFGEVSNKSKLIITIHDLSFERYAETFSWKRRFWHIFINPKKICQKAEKIIAVSNSTKRDLILLYGCSEKKIKVIPNGVSEKFKIIDRNNKKLLQVKEGYNLPYRFILYLGTIEPRKNIIGIIRAYNQLRKFAKKENNKELQKYKLVITVSNGWLSKKIFLEIQRSANKENIILVDFIKDVDKEYVFNLASLFIYPSFFEGFGFPPLEALRCGVPVITSNSSSLPEISGKNAILIDPNKPDEIFKAAKTILLNKDFQKKIMEKKSGQIGEFDWNKAARYFLRIVTK